MLKSVLVAVAFGAGVTGAYLVGHERHESPPVAPPSQTAERPAEHAAPPALGLPPPGATLQDVVEGTRRLAQQRPPIPRTPAERRQQIDAQLNAGDPTARLNAFRALSLEDRAAAESVARQRLSSDPALFADCARLLLVRDGAPASRDMVEVRRGLRTLRLDEPTRAAVSGLVLETLVRLRSPAAPLFAADLLRSPSESVRTTAIKVMVSMRLDRQVPLLIGALGDRAPGVRRAARSQLAYLAHKDLGDAPAAWSQWWKAVSKPARAPGHSLATPRTPSPD